MASVMPASSNASSAATAAATTTAASRPTTHPYSCNACQVAFRNLEQQRAHMHTDWHRYNLKRRITSLPPLPSEVFAEKVLHIQATNKLEAEKASFQKECRTCNKTYFSENAYQNHVNSSKHRQNVAAEALGIKTRPAKDTEKDEETGSVISSAFSLGEPVGPEGMDAPASVPAVVKEETDAELKQGDKDFAKELEGLSLKQKEAAASSSSKKEGESTEEGAADDDEEPEPLPLTTCLFCNYSSPSVQLNASHMSKAHGLFIPEQKYLVDLEGLIAYLGEKLIYLNECLYCGKVKGGLEGVQTHMRDVGHCKIAFETEDQQLELGEFYDFRASYDDDGDWESEDEDDEEKPKGLKSNKKSTDAEGDFKTEDGQNGDDAGWETDSSASSLDSTELTAVPLDHIHAQDGERTHNPPRHRREDGYHSHAHRGAHTTAVYHTEYELHLPSGRTAGHRSLNRYFRQNLSHPLSERMALAAQRRGSDAAADAAEHSDEERGDTGVQRELTRRERRDLFFGRMGDEERVELVGTRHERGLSTRGEAGMLGVSAAKRREVAAAERRGRVIEERERRKVGWRVDKQGNSQKHYRDPLLQ